ncbi:MAG: chemotaxis-specific protein-glutamate methyltransferase CheB [Thermoguttaceae bacterium]
MRVAIVNDLRIATEALRQIVCSQPGNSVAWTAASGEEAVHRYEKDQPDVILMDLVMPGMNGAEATRLIMQRRPCPILVVTATVAGNYDLVCQALGHGAYDAVATPVVGDRPPQEAGAHLLARLKAVERIRGDSRPTSPPAGVSAQGPRSAPTAADMVPLVAIGASTGGPQALEKILASLPADFPAAVVIVQHIAAEFAGSLAQWLQERSKLKVRLAVPGDWLTRGTALVAATNDHLVVRSDRRLAYRAEPVNLPYRPSVNVLFETMAENWPSPAVAIVLTGIGRDGADGLLKLRRRGWHTISQDEKTSVVYGMPQAAAQIGASDRILPLEEIGPHIAQHLRRPPMPPRSHGPLAPGFPHEPAT